MEPQKEIENSYSLVNEIHKLHSQMELLNKQMWKLTSTKYVMLNGFISGISTAIGATILFAILVLILSNVLQGLESIPFLDQIVDRIPWETLIEKSK